jgi:hypothetical protein
MEDWPWPQGPFIDLTLDEDDDDATLNLSRFFMYISMYIFMSFPFFFLVCKHYY